MIPTKTKMLTVSRVLILRATAMNPRRSAQTGDTGPRRARGADSMGGGADAESPERSGALLGHRQRRELSFQHQGVALRFSSD